jgi:hypothetical protein
MSQTEEQKLAAEVAAGRAAMKARFGGANKQMGGKGKVRFEVKFHFVNARFPFAVSFRNSEKNPRQSFQRRRHGPRGQEIDGRRQQVL